ncbi:MAG: hypothetical protein J7484_07485 [Microbacterium sp.]|nr:hypothetical protein [Microbacterium sp.]
MARTDHGLVRPALGILLLASLTVTVTGCGVFFGFDDGAPEAERLAAIVEELPGVESVTADGTAQNFEYAANAHVSVRMGADAGAAELEGVLLAWQKAVTDGGKDRIRNQIAVELGSSDCAAEAVSKIDEDQLKGTALFLPALCAAVDGAVVSISDTWDRREVFIGHTSLPLDVEQLHALPGAATEHLDYWRVDEQVYRWGDD